MAELPHPGLSGWDNFYVIVGSSGAALIGLQFVVITLIADRRARTTSGSISAFGTRTAVHLAGALLISVVMSAPWPTLVGISVALAACGIAGVAYGASVVARARRQTLYRPVMEDWLFHVILPCCVYAALAIAAVALHASTHVAPFIIGGAALALLLIGIHNAWDTVTWIVTDGAPSNGTGDA